MRPLPRTSVSRRSSRPATAFGLGVDDPARAGADLSGSPDAHVPGAADLTELSPAPQWWPVHPPSGFSPAPVKVHELAPRISRVPARKRKVPHFNVVYNVSVDSMDDTHLLASSDVDQTLDVWLFGTAADPMHDDHLLAALSDLEQAVNEARDEGFQPPSDEALQNAERLLRDMYRLRRYRFEVYPTEDREIAVSAPGGRGRSVLVLCDSDGGVRCSVNLNGEHRRAVYDPDSAVKLPDGFMREALAALDE